MMNDGNNVCQALIEEARFAHSVQYAEQAEACDMPMSQDALSLINVQWSIREMLESAVSLLVSLLPKDDWVMVLNLYAQGASVKSIARTMFLSEKTIYRDIRDTYDWLNRNVDGSTVCISGVSHYGHSD